MARQEIIPLRRGWFTGAGIAAAARAASAALLTGAKPAAGRPNPRSSKNAVDARMPAAQLAGAGADADSASPAQAGP